MKASDYFPSQYLRCADLNGKERIATIAKVDTAIFENDGKKQTKPVIYFEEAALKPLVANKTNFLLIAASCGDDTDQWPGKQIVLYPDLVGYKGVVTETIRAKRAPSPKPPLAEAMNGQIGI
jgi:hypothetical protein